MRASNPALQEGWVSDVNNWGGADFARAEELLGPAKKKGRLRGRGLRENSKREANKLHLAPAYRSLLPSSLSDKSM